MAIKGEKMEAVTDKITADGDCSHEIRWWLLLGRKVMTNLDSIFKKQRHHFADNGPYSQGYGLSSSHVRMWKLDHKEGRVPKNWCFWTVVLGKTLESPLGYKEIKPVNPKESQSWIFIGGTDAEAEALILCPPDVKSRLTGKDPDAEKGRRRGRQRMKWLDGITNSMGMNWGQLQMLRDKEACSAAVHGVTKNWTRLGDWTTMWDLSSPTRDRTCTPCSGQESPNHWTAREVPKGDVFISFK